MTFQKAIFICPGLVCVLAAPACGGDGTAPGKPPPDCASIDYSTYKTAAVPSFETDIMPIFGGSCTASDCHNNHDKKAWLDLGVRCQGSGSGATYTCTFPTTPPDPSAQNPPQPLTPDIITAAHASLLLPAKTVNAPDGGPYKVMRVVPGDPEHSFLMQKVQGTQDDQHYSCTNQDTTRSTGVCGNPMPLGALPLCEGTSRPRFDLLAAWIQGGAPNN